MGIKYVHKLKIVKRHLSDRAYCSSKITETGTTFWKNVTCPRCLIKKCPLQFVSAVYLHPSVAKYQINCKMR